MTTFPTTCPRCAGDGCFDGWPPTPTPHGPSYPPDVRCTSCDGTGVVEEPDEPRTLEDLEIEDMEMAL